MIRIFAVARYWIHLDEAELESLQDLCVSVWWKVAVGAQRPAAPFHSHFNKEWIRSSIPAGAAWSATQSLSGYRLMRRDFQGLGLSYQPLLYL